MPCPRCGGNHGPGGSALSQRTVLLLVPGPAARGRGGTVSGVRYVTSGGGTSSQGQPIMIRNVSLAGGAVSGVGRSQSAGARPVSASGGTGRVTSTSAGRSTSGNQGWGEWLWNTASSWVGGGSGGTTANTAGSSNMGPQAGAVRNTTMNVTTGTSVRTPSSQPVSERRVNTTSASSQAVNTTNAGSRRDNTSRSNSTNRTGNNTQSTRSGSAPATRRTATTSYGAGNYSSGQVTKVQSGAGVSSSSTGAGRSTANAYGTGTTAYTSGLPAQRGTGVSRSANTTQGGVTAAYANDKRSASTTSSNNREKTTYDTVNKPSSSNTALQSSTGESARSYSFGSDYRAAATEVQAGSETSRYTRATSQTRTRHDASNIRAPTGTNVSATTRYGSDKYKTTESMQADSDSRTHRSKTSLHGTGSQSASGSMQAQSSTKTGSLSSGSVAFRNRLDLRGNSIGSYDSDLRLSQSIKSAALAKIPVQLDTFNAYFTFPISIISCFDKTNDSDLKMVHRAGDRKECEIAFARESLTEQTSVWKHYLNNGYVSADESGIMWKRGQLACVSKAGYEERYGALKRCIPLIIPHSSITGCQGLGSDASVLLLETTRAPRQQVLVVSWYVMSRSKFEARENVFQMLQYFALQVRKDMGHENVPIIIGCDFDFDFSINVRKNLIDGFIVVENDPSNEQKGKKLIDGVLFCNGREITDPKPITSPNAKPEHSLKNTIDICSSKELSHSNSNKIEPKDQDWQKGVQGRNNSEKLGTREESRDETNDGGKTNPERSKGDQSRWRNEIRRSNLSQLRSERAKAQPRDNDGRFAKIEPAASVVRPKSIAPVPSNGASGYLQSRNTVSSKPPFQLDLFSQYFPISTVTINLNQGSSTNYLKPEIYEDARKVLENGDFGVAFVQEIGAPTHDTWKLGLDEFGYNNSGYDAGIMWSKQKLTCIRTVEKHERETALKSINHSHPIELEIVQRACVLLLETQTEPPQQILAVSWHGRSNRITDELKMAQFYQLQLFVRQIRKDIGKENVPIIIGGDFNLDLTKVTDGDLIGGFTVLECELSERRKGKKAVDGYLYSKGVDVTGVRPLPHGGKMDHCPGDGVASFKTVQEE